MPVGKPATRGSRQEARERFLLEAAQKDPSRFAELYENNFERVYAFVARRVRERQVAEDLTGEVFHKALTKLSGFDWRGIRFAAWLLRIAANVVNDHWKRSAREELVEDPPEASHQVTLEETGAALSPGRRPPLGPASRDWNAVRRGKDDSRDRE